MAQLFAGTSGWAYPSWKPDFYPAKLAQKKFLGHYATQLNTVEVNFTFRQLVKETTIQNWIQETPAAFSLRREGSPGDHSHQATEGDRGLCPHDFWRRLSLWPPPENSARFFSNLPPNLKADPALLKDFLADPAAHVPAAFEFRHASWFSDATWICCDPTSRLVRCRDRDHDHPRGRDRRRSSTTASASRATAATNAAP